jgi:hypothetical protein
MENSEFPTPQSPVAKDDPSETFSPFETFPGPFNPKCKNNSSSSKSKKSSISSDFGFQKDSLLIESKEKGKFPKSHDENPTSVLSKESELCSEDDSEDHRAFNDKFEKGSRKNSDLLKEEDFKSSTFQVPLISVESLDVQPSSAIPANESEPRSPSSQEIQSNKDSVSHRANTSYNYSNVENFNPDQDMDSAFTIGEQIQFDPVKDFPTSELTSMKMEENDLDEKNNEFFQVRENGKDEKNQRSFSGSFDKSESESCPEPPSKMFVVESTGKRESFRDETVPSQFESKDGFSESRRDEVKEKSDLESEGFHELPSKVFVVESPEKKESFEDETVPGYYESKDTFSESHQEEVKEKSDLESEGFHELPSKVFVVESPEKKESFEDETVPPHFESKDEFSESHPKELKEKSPLESSEKDEILSLKIEEKPEYHPPDVQSTIFFPESENPVKIEESSESHFQPASPSLEFHQPIEEVSFDPDFECYELVLNTSRIKKSNIIKYNELQRKFKVSSFQLHRNLSIIEKRQLLEKSSNLKRNNKEIKQNLLKVEENVEEIRNFSEKILKTVFNDLPQKLQFEEIVFPELSSNWVKLEADSVLIEENQTNDRIYHDFYIKSLKNYRQSELKIVEMNTMEELFTVTLNPNESLSKRVNFLYETLKNHLFLEFQVLLCSVPVSRPLRSYWLGIELFENDSVQVFNKFLTLKDCLLMIDGKEVEKFTIKNFDSLKLKVLKPFKSLLVTSDSKQVSNEITNS